MNEASSFTTGIERHKFHLIWIKIKFRPNYHVTNKKKKRKNDLSAPSSTRALNTET